jgi:hypothetical protein
MRKLFDNRNTEEFAEGAARAVWVQAWADHQEQKGKTLRGELMHQAPATPLSAYVWAGELMGRLAELNKSDIHRLSVKAVEADLARRRDVPFSMVDFGHYMAMQALGHGVSWFDDHAQFAIKIPHMEYDFYPG